MKDSTDGVVPEINLSVKLMNLRAVDFIGEYIEFTGVAMLINKYYK